MTAGAWAGLFSGGKDSSWAVHRALRTGRDVEILVTVHPPEESFMYHVPGTELAALAAESMGIPLLEVDTDYDVDHDDSAKQGDREIEPLEAAIADRAAGTGLVGVTAGAVSSEYQSSRIRAMCDRLGLELFAPLWGADPRRLAEEMVESGFEIRIVRVAAAGLDASWLGRRYDEDALADLEALHEQHGVHVLGEGGEFETIVTDGPHMTRPIEFEAEPAWRGTWGDLVIRDAWLG